MTEYRITSGNLLPTLNRHMVGFDRLFGDVDRLFTQQAPSYPPYNIERVSDTEYVITVAVAGFEEGDINVTVDNGMLTIAGHKESGNGNANMIHKGIATRDFQRSWNLAEFVEVVSAENSNGMLKIILKQEIPEALKPKQIKIKYLK